MKKLLSILTLLLWAPAYSDDIREYDVNDNREIYTKVWGGTHYLERAFQRGVAELMVTADCQTTEEKAKAQVKTALNHIRSEIEATAKDLNLGETNELWNYKLDNRISHMERSPIENVTNLKDPENPWRNRCTGKSYPGPVRPKKVHSGTTSIQISFPNTGTLLNHLTKLVQKLEALPSEAALERVEIKSLSHDGSSFTLDVTEAVNKATWAEVEAVAKERAYAAMQADITSRVATTPYTNIWDGSEGFQRGRPAGLPNLNVVKEGGKWIGKYFKNRNFTVSYKKMSKMGTERSLLSGQKNYSVPVKSESSEGLYGEVTLTAELGCQSSKADARSKLQAVSSDLLNLLRKINQGRAERLNRLVIGEVTTTSENPYVRYRAIVGDQVVHYYYNQCTLGLSKSKERPYVQVWRASQTLTIVADKNNLDKLAELAQLNRLDQNDPVVSDLKDATIAALVYRGDDPNQLKVTASKLKGKATLEARQAESEKLDRLAFAAFDAEKSDYRCDASGYSFACLLETRPLIRRRPAGGARRDGLAKESLRDEAPEPDAKERGVKPFEGTYKIQKTVRLVLKNQRR